MTNHEAAERAYVLAMVEHADRQLADATAEMHADLGRLRATWAESYSAEREASEAGIAAIRENTARWLQDFYDDGADEGAPIDVAHGQGVGAFAGQTAPAGPAEPGRGQPNPAAGLAERPAGLTLSEFAAERDRLIRANTSRGLFG